MFTPRKKFPNAPLGTSGGAPSGSAGGDLAGTYPNPTVKADVGLTGNPTAPTQASSDDSTRIASTAFVQALFTALRNGVSSAFDTLAEIATELALKAPLASPALTGTPTAPTASAGTNNTQVATTAYVDTAVSVGVGGGLALLESHTASASVSLDFTTAISASHDHYHIQGHAIIPATDATNLVMQFSTDGGSSWISTGYQWGYEFLNPAGGNGRVGSGSDSTIHIANANKNVRGVSFELTVYGPGLAAICRVKTQVVQQNSGDSGEYMYQGFALDPSTAARNAIRFTFSSGNIASGTIRVYGFAK